MGSGCGNTLQFNFVTGVSANTPLKTVALLPGDSKTDLTLMRDGLMYAYQGATMKARDCKQEIVVETKFDTWEGDAIRTALHGPNSRPWKETWTVWACGKLVDVPIHFVPDNNGTVIHVDGPEVTAKP